MVGSGLSLMGYGSFAALRMTVGNVILRVSPGDRRIRPGRRPLLEEGAHALLSVGGQRVQGHDLLSVVVGRGLWHLELAVEGLLADPDHERRGGRDAL